MSGKISRRMESVGIVSTPAVGVTLLALATAMSKAKRPYTLPGKVLDELRQIWPDSAGLERATLVSLLSDQINQAENVVNLSIIHNITQYPVSLLGKDATVTVVGRTIISITLNQRSS